jgi:hypothetical protein
VIGENDTLTGNSCLSGVNLNTGTHLKIGDKVNHEDHGDGTVTKVDSAAGKVEIEWDGSAEVNVHTRPVPYELAQLNTSAFRRVAGASNNSRWCMPAEADQETEDDEPRGCSATGLVGSVVFGIKQKETVEMKAIERQDLTEEELHARVKHGEIYFEETRHVAKFVVLL